MWLSDEEFIYRQDIKEKKRISQGARHKRGGSKSKKCTLPSDYLTKKEKEKMNGEVFVYNPNNWYSWEEFKAMPMEYQVKYVNSLLNRYNCGLTTISKIVFEKSPECLSQHFREHKQMGYINAPKKGARVNYRESARKLLEAMERDLWSNRDEIQNGSPKPIGKVTKVEETSEGLVVEADLTEEGKKLIEKMEDDMPKVVDQLQPTEVSSFAVMMDKMDFDIFEYVAKLFEGKRVSVHLEVKVAD